MSIIGLENDNYCVHTPIPVEITGAAPDPAGLAPTLRLEISISGSTEDLITPPFLWGNPENGNFYVDVAPWVRMVMGKIEDTLSYGPTLTTVADPYSQTFTLSFVDILLDSQDITKTFVHCALFDGYRSDDSPFTDIRVWKCLPFSWLSGGNRNLIVPQTNTPPSIAGVNVDYDTSCCGGTYIKWLNEYGFYNYWNFPNSRELVNEAEEIYRIPRSIFDPNKNSNFDTAGFSAREKMTVRDMIPRRFWPLMRSLVASPDVYMLREIKENVTPDDWIKIVQTDAKFERDTIGKTMSQFEIEFEIPKVYAQNRL